MFCEYCGASMSDDARFCPACGRQRRSATAALVQNRCPGCGQPAADDDIFCFRCGHRLKEQPQPAVPEPEPAPPSASVPPSAPPEPGSLAEPPSADAELRTMTGRRVILTNRAFTHEELLQFMLERWDTANYNRIVTDPAMSQYTKLYVLLPATPRYMIIVYSRAAGGLFTKENKVVLSVINTPAGAGEMLMRSIPTQNAIFGIAKIANTMSAKAEREGPTEQILQKYTDYMRYLLQNAGYLR